MPILVRVRDDLWSVESTTESTDRTLYTLRNLETGAKLRVLSPPDEVEIVSGSVVELDRRALSPFSLWQLRHELLRLTSVSDELVAVHAGRVQLEPYQLVPLTRLLRSAHRNLLIADDVGLGKTIEAGLCIVEQAARGSASRVLLVVPPGLVDQWVEEMLKRFGLKFVTLEDSLALDSAQTALAEGISPWGFHDRVITSVEFLKRPDVREAALRRPWDMIIVDEAHYLAVSGSAANPHETQRSHLGRALRAKTNSLLLLTATPHNGYRHSFRSLRELIEPTDAALAGDDDRVRQRVARSMVRRLKQQITKTDSEGRPVPAFMPRAPVVRLEVHCSIDGEREVFRLVTEYCMRTIEAAEATDQRDVVSFAMQIVKKRMLSSRLALLRTVEKRLDFLRAEAQDDRPSRSDVRELQGDLPLSETAAERLVDRVLRGSVPREVRRRTAEQRQLRQVLRTLRSVADRPDPKVARLVAELRDVLLPYPDEKAIVFTEYRDSLEAVRDALRADPDLHSSVVELVGGLSSVQRRRRIDDFANPEARILLATDAASEGLNLQRYCRRLYHMELPWNPNRLEQRNGRIDRHGQTRTPHIAYLFYADSPEDRVLDRLVARISQMQGDKVSTPDIIGVVEATRLPDRLMTVQDLGEVEATATDLVRVFDEECSRFQRDLGPLLSAAALATDDGESTSADPLIRDDLEFEAAMLRLLGTSARGTGDAHVLRIDVPVSLQGPRVPASYFRATFRRSIALADGMQEVAFIHRYHPLAQCAANVAQETLSAAPSHLTRPPAIAVRRLQGLNEPSAVFTFVDRSLHRAGVPLAVGVSLSGAELGRAVVQRSLQLDQHPGDAAWSEVTETFLAVFPRLQEHASRLAGEQAAEIVRRERSRRLAMSEHLRQEVDIFRRDRLVEIGREEAAERAGTRDQVDLFRELRVDWEARRAAIATQADRRLSEIAAWESEPSVATPEPLGVLFLFPGAAS